MSRAHIFCDACEAPNPTMRCSKCKLVHYCSVACQRAHFREHKPDCRPIEEMRRLHATSCMVPQAPSIDVAGQTTDECGICLDTVRQPVPLQCGHAFCFQCLRDYQAIAVNPTCPLCRSELPDVRSGVIDRAALHAARAIKLVAGEKQAQCERAKSELQTVLDADPEDLQANHTLAEVLLISGEAQSAVETFQRVLELNASNQRARAEMRRLLSMADAADAAGDHAQAERLMDQLEATPKVQTFAGGELGLLETKLKLAEAHQAAADFSAALDLYMSIVSEMGDDHTFGTPKLQLKLWMGMNRVFFEIGQYDRVIKGSGPMATGMNRHYPGVHKYIALSEKATGDLTAAVKTMSRAVLYEAPWDEDNLAQNRALLQELVAEQQG